MSGPNATVTRTNVLAGPGQLWWGLFSTAVEPLDDAVGDPPGATYADLGGTNGGLTVTVNQTFFDMRVDQVADSLGRRLTERDTQISTNLAEGTLENLARAFNLDPADIIDGGVANFRSLEMEAGQDAFIPIEAAIIVDGWAPGTAVKRRFIGRRVTSIESVGSSWQKDGQLFVPVTFSALFVDSTTSPVKWTDEVPAP